MFGTAIIETVIGLMLVFSLTAILVTQINGIITTILNFRAKQLKQGITEIVTDKQVQAKLLAHPIINMVKTSVPPGARLTDEQAENITKIEATRVEYIEPSTFAEAIIGILMADSKMEIFDKFRDAINAMPSSMEKSELREILRDMRIGFREEALRKAYTIIQTISDEQHQQALLAGLHEIEAELEALQFDFSELIPLLEGIQNIDDDKFKSALETVLVTAHSVEQARDKIADWFDDSMTRVSRSFAQNMQRISFIVALTLTLTLNIDTWFIGMTLWENPELRQSVAQAATELDRAQQQPPKLSTEDATELSPEELQEQVAQAEMTVQNLLDLQIPLGWQYTTVTDQMVADALALGFPNPRQNPRNIWSFFPGNNSAWLELWLQKLLGLALTVIAAAQGAPFWFDLLNKITRR